MRFHTKKLPLLTALACGLFLSLAVSGCNDDDDDEPRTPTQPQAPAPPPAGGSAWLRVAQLTEDARTVDVALNGEVVFRGVPFAGVSGYRELTPGEYRVQFFATGTTTPSLVETILRVAEGRALTVASLGVPPIQIDTMRDDLSPVPNRARVKLFNAVPDFPARFDLAVRNGPRLVDDVGFTQASSYEELIPGLYDLELVRSGTPDVIATSLGESLRAGANYTVFAFGTLRRNDIRLLVALNSG